MATKSTFGNVVELNRSLCLDSALMLHIRCMILDTPEKSSEKALLRIPPPPPPPPENRETYFSRRVFRPE